MRIFLVRIYGNSSQEKTKSEISDKCCADNIQGVFPKFLHGKKFFETNKPKKP